jgi:hypothetical protein
MSNMVGVVVGFARRHDEDLCPQNSRRGTAKCLRRCMFARGSCTSHSEREGVSRGVKMVCQRLGMVVRGLGMG